MSENLEERYTLDTPAGLLDVVLAQLSNVEEILSILEDARQWLVAKGLSEQWPRPHPAEAIAWRIEQHKTYLAYREGPAIATFTLQRSDEPTWGDRHGAALYVHGLAVRRAYAGRQIGERLLQLAGEICNSLGKTYLRLDCWAGNEALRRYYERAGFELRGTLEWPVTGSETPRRINLFEKKLP